jgi:penicillin-binding protein 1C
MEYYYKQKNPTYKVLPRYKSNCLIESKKPMAFIYPKENVSVFLPKDFNGKTNELIIKVAHSTRDIKIFWYLNKTFIGSTTNFHEIAIQPKIGFYIITALDELGNEIKKSIEIKA